MSRSENVHSYSEETTRYGDDIGIEAKEKFQKYDGLKTNKKF